MSTKTKVNAQVRNSTTNDPVTIEGTLLVIGDLHTSPKYKGKHIDYALSSIKVLELVEEQLLAAKRKGVPISLMLLGDTFGVNERNFNAEYFLAEVGRWYSRFNRICEGRVFSVRGNHDMGEYTTFDFAKDMGWISNPPYIDMKDAQGDIAARFHVVNYGHEKDELEINPDVDNVVFGHNDYSIPGITNTYGGKTGETHRGDKVILANLDNFSGVSLVVSGHIHTPLIRNDMEATLPDGSVIKLIIPGSPSRVAERIEKCYSVVFNSVGDAIDYNLNTINLWPLEEEFLPEEYTDEQKEIAKDLEQREKNIDEIISSVTEGRFLERFDNLAQIEKIPGFTAEARTLAKERYLAARAAL